MVTLNCQWCDGSFSPPNRAHEHLNLTLRLRCGWYDCKTELHSAIGEDVFNGKCPNCHREDITILDRMVDNKWEPFKIFNRSKLPNDMKFNWSFIHWIPFENKKKY